MTTTELIDIILPAEQLEGTEAKVAKWLFAPGQAVNQGQPLVELETDKVVMELCAEHDGVLQEILAPEGTTIGPDSLVARLTPASAAPSQPQDSASKIDSASQGKAESLVDIVFNEDDQEGTKATMSKWLVEAGQSVNSGDPVAELETDKVTVEIVAPETGVILTLNAQVGEDVSPGQVLANMSTEQVSSAPSVEAQAAPVPVASADTTLPNTNTDTDTDTEDCSQLCSPAVRRLLMQHDLQLVQITGTGRRGRVTRDDVRAYIANISAQTVTAPVTATPTSTAAATLATDVPTSAIPGKIVAHTPMRKAIAKHMTESLLQISPHVTSVFELDMTNLIEHRKWHKKEFAEQGVKLTFTAYFLAAAAKAMQAVPQINARYHEDALEMFSDVNIGVGTALGDDGLVVPVVKQVQNMNLFSIAQALGAQTEKARSGKLTAADMKHGTFTISNHGVSGSLFAAPIIINQPQVAILGIGKLEKRVVVESINGRDEMVIKPKCYVSLSIDHRALDAHQTNLWLSAFVETLENWGQ